MAPLLTLMGSLLVLQAAQQAQAPFPAIIERLTKDTMAQAAACGQSGEQCAVAPYELCPADTPRRYDARIATPFSRVAAANLEAAKAGRKGRPLEAPAVNRWGVGIYVFPAAGSAAAEAIQRVEIRREGKPIQPRTTTVGPIAAKMPDGSTKQLSRGFFSFSADAFSASADVTVVFVSASGESTCTLDQNRLKALR